MASPQLENGYTRIANEILEAVTRTPFTATHLKIILVCWRFTYGFGRKEAELSLNFIVNATNISKRYISEALNELIDSNILVVVKEPTYSSSRIIAFNKNYKDWRYRDSGTPLQQVNPSSTVEAGQDTTVEPQFNTTVEPQFHQERKHKENINKGDYEDFFEKLWKLYPKKRGKGQISKTQKKRLFKIGYDKMVKAIELYKKEREGQDPQFTAYGSTFFNTLYLDFLKEAEEKAMPALRQELKFVPYEDGMAKIEEENRIKAEAISKRNDGLVWKEVEL